MERRLFAKSLNEGYIERHTLDLSHQRFAIQVHVLERGVLSVYEVEFAGVSHFQFDDKQVGDWERLQLTQLWIDEAPENSGTEEWAVSFSLWDLAHVTLRCTSISIDGESVR